MRDALGMYCSALGANCKSLDADPALMCLVQCRLYITEVAAYTASTATQACPVAAVLVHGCETENISRGDNM